MALIRKFVVSRKEDTRLYRQAVHKANGGVLNFLDSLSVLLRDNVTIFLHSSI